MFFTAFPIQIFHVWKVEGEQHHLWIVAISLKFASKWRPGIAVLATLGMPALPFPGSPARCLPCAGWLWAGSDPRHDVQANAVSAAERTEEPDDARGACVSQPGRGAGSCTLGYDSLADGEWSLPLLQGQSNNNCHRCCCTMALTLYISPDRKGTFLLWAFHPEQGNVHLKVLSGLILELLCGAILRDVFL